MKITSPFTLLTGVLGLSVVVGSEAQDVTKEKVELA